MHKRLKDLYQKFLDDSCTTDEYQELIALMDALKEDPFLHRLLDESWSKLSSREDVALPAKQAVRIFQKIVKSPQFKRKTFYKRNFWAAAAMLIITLSVSFYFYTNRASNRSLNYSKTIGTEIDVQPGSTKAVLTLANGKKIDLDQANIGAQVVQSDLQINKADTGLVTFSIPDVLNATGRDAEIAWNTITTPKGGVFKVILPDGSLVFLNASSSLSFPTYFASDERQVKLSGEAYFEIERSKGNKGAKNCPFIVSVGAQRVEVLGTKFNITAYNDVPSMVTTLLSGAVKITTAQEISQNPYAVVLKPGEQAVMDKSSRKIVVSQADIEEALAWKDGYFLFNNETLKEIMEKIARWYNVEVQYHGNSDSVRFLGIYDRSKSLKKLLNDLEKTRKVRFELKLNENDTKERRIIVIAK